MFEYLTEIHDIIERSKPIRRFYEDLDIARNHTQKLVAEVVMLEKRQQELTDNIHFLNTEKTQKDEEIAVLNLTVTSLREQVEAETATFNALRTELEENHIKNLQNLEAEYIKLSQDLTAAYNKQVELAQTTLAQLKTEIDALTQSRDYLLQKFALLRP